MYYKRITNDSNSSRLATQLASTIYKRAMSEHTFPHFLIQFIKSGLDQLPTVRGWLSTSLHFGHDFKSIYKKIYIYIISNNYLSCLRAATAQDL